MPSLLNIGIGGLRAQQAALNVIGQNITNASTPGYSRQRADLTTQTGAFTGSKFSGAGAQVSAITRIADEFVNNQIRTDRALSSELEAFTNNIGQLERTVFDDGFGIDSALSDFFSAIEDASANPLDTAARQFVLDRGAALAYRFGDVSDRMTQQAKDIDAQVIAGTRQVNDIAENLAELNNRILAVQGNDESGALNALADQRDILLNELSSWVSINSSVQADGQVNVFVGKGQSLVLGGEHATFEVTESGSLYLRRSGSSIPQDITGSISGGTIGGLLNYRSQVLEPMQSQFGHLAASIVASFNEQHQLGVDLSGEFGNDFFRSINDPALVGERVTSLAGGSTVSSLGKVNIYIDDPMAGLPTDYELEIAQDGTYTVTRTSDRALVFQGAGISTPSTIEFDGLRVEFASGSFTANDTLLLRPYASFAADIEVNIQDPGEIALAAPISVEANIANSGTASLTVATITDTQHPIFSGDDSLVPPLLVRFINDHQYEILDNSDPTNPRRLQPDLGVQNYVQGFDNHILPYELGTTVVNSSGTLAGRVPAAATFTSSLGLGANNYPAGSIAVNYADDAGNISAQVATFAANSSAKQIAAGLSGLPGVSASARTTVTLSNFVDYDAGTPVEIGINGQTFSGYSTPQELATMINEDALLSSQGIVARSNGTSIELVSNVGDDLNLSFQGDPAESVTVTDGFGQSLLVNGGGPGNYRRATIGGEIAVVLDPNATLNTQLPGIFAANPDYQRADFGFDLVLSGNVSAGDTYAVAFNGDAPGDNRNAHALSRMSESDLIGHPPTTFGAAFAILVQEVGSASSQAKVNSSAAASLLQQSESYRESISGVNLDEEAANLIRFEQAYNASAQVISAARDMFNVLLQSIR